VTVKHRRGYTGRKYRPRRRPTPKEPTLQRPVPGQRSIAQDRRERLQIQLAREAAMAERRRLEAMDGETARLMERDAAAPMTPGAVWRDHRRGTTTAEVAG